MGLLINEVLNFYITECWEQIVLQLLNPSKKLPHYESSCPRSDQINPHLNPHYSNMYLLLTLLK